MLDIVEDDMTAEQNAIPKFEAINQALARFLWCRVRAGDALL